MGRLEPSHDGRMDVAGVMPSEILGRARQHGDTCTRPIFHPPRKLKNQQHGGISFYSIVLHFAKSPIIYGLLTAHIILREGCNFRSRGLPVSVLNLLRIPVSAHPCKPHLIQTESPALRLSESEDTSAARACICREGEVDRKE